LVETVQAAKREEHKRLPESVGLPPRHVMLVLAVVAIWGTNFVVIHEGLKQFPPLLFAALRFIFSAFPAILFLPRPAAPWRITIAYGLLIGAGQFGILYIAMAGHIAPGLASLVIQLQVPFTIALSAAIFGEKLRLRQLATFALCALGLVAVAKGNQGSASLLGLALVLGAAASWAVANILVKKAGAVRMLDFIVWSSVAAIPPLFGLSLAFEGPDAIVQSLQSASPAGWSAVLWQSVGNTLFGFAAWSWLLARHPAASVTPAAILVPVFGLGSAALLLGEPMPLMKVLGAALILLGVGVELALALRRRIAA
jgi:O-acetylserine/cysteine efflux transporter